MTPEDKKKADTAISKTVLQRPEVIDAKTICSYISYGGEADTKQLITQLKKTGKIVVGPDAALKTSPDLFIVPGLGFDRELHRLGRGGGYYDKLLADVTVPKIGLAYEIQMVAKVPHTAYDVPMDTVVTEKVYENKAS